MTRPAAATVVPFNANLPAVGYFQSGDDPEQRRLAASARSEDDGGFTGRDLERDVVQRDDASRMRLLTPISAIAAAFT